MESERRLETQSETTSIDSSDQPASSLDDDKWKAIDGTRYHQAIQREIMTSDRFEYVEEEVGCLIKDKDGNMKEGRMDLLMDEKDVVDIKTDDMSQWSVSRASREGMADGQQVREYTVSEGMPKDAKGYVLACGRTPEDPQAAAAYEEAINRQGVTLIWGPESGEPKEAAEILERRIAGSADAGGKK
jgi:hypothetical protein